METLMLLLSTMSKMNLHRVLGPCKFGEFVARIIISLKTEELPEQSGPCRPGLQRDRIIKNPTWIQSHRENSRLLSAAALNSRLLSPSDSRSAQICVHERLCWDEWTQLGMRWGRLPFSIFSDKLFKKRSHSSQILTSFEPHTLH